MAITKKEKELAAVGISIAAGCKPCTDYHMKAVREAGTSDGEIRRAIEDAVALRNAATSIMRNYGRSHLGDTDHEDAIATRHAESAGVTRAEILEITKLAKFIKERGASHVDRRI